MTYLSPLRYPGGKRKLSEFMKDVVLINKIQNGSYIEPFAGGASIALYLLLYGFVKKIYINDIDRSIYAFWISAINDTDQLCKKIFDTPINIDTWDIQKQIQKDKDNASLLDLGFSTFFLNRTNRSGILSGGVLGGKDQKSKTKINDRFNKTELIKRIYKIADQKKSIFVYCADAISFVKKIISKDIGPFIIYFDPPYYIKGSVLYLNHFKHDDHLGLSRFIKDINGNWILTYDCAPEIQKMYEIYKYKHLYLNYSASKKSTGHEIIFYSDSIKLPLKKYQFIRNE